MDAAVESTVGTTIVATGVAPAVTGSVVRAVPVRGAPIKNARQQRTARVAVAVWQRRFFASQ